ncbi:hypothetical protein ACFW1A_23060 [Kitasatospora sp. NPDC058965]|uniref:hypothetical protein n=1 Tax=Kitasatospora sp. NPDC058965 TaxID=3346682 RepID=UPI0036768BBE
MRGPTAVRRLAVGHRADLTVFPQDPLTVPDTEPAELPLLLAVLAGRPTHRAAGPQERPGRARGTGRP